MTIENEIKYDLCDTQGFLYIEAYKQGYNIENFHNRFMNSETCKNYFDTNYSRLQLADAYECLDFLLPEIKTDLYFGANNFSAEIAEWIGFIFRLLCIETKISSRELCKIISFTDMLAYYPGLHTIETTNAIDIIKKDYNL